MATWSGSSDLAAAHPETAAPRAAAVRWGGALVAACALTFLVTIVLYATVYGQPAGTGAGGEVTTADKAGHVLAKWQLIGTLWLVEASAWLLLAVAAFVLQHRAPRAGPALLPVGVAWAAVGVGAIVQALMYAFTFGAYPSAAAAAAETPAIFEAMNGAATFVHPPTTRPEPLTWLPPTSGAW